MLSSVFELLADARSQITSINAAIEAQRDFWVADAELQFVIHGGSFAITSLAGTAAPVAAPAAAAH